MKIQTFLWLIASYTNISLTYSVSRRLLPVCRDATFTVTGSTTDGLKLQNPPDKLALDAITNAYFTQPIIQSNISGSYKIYGQYCEPLLSIPLKTKTLIILVHGLTYDHTYWNGFQANPDDGNIYSMAAHLNRQGYSTLAIDKLGSGRSDHPDPVNVVQIPFQRELYHNLITQLRDTSQLPIPTGWPRIILIGHSMGSMIGASIVAKYPADIDGLVLTGIAKRSPDQSEAGIFDNDWLQASTYDPRRFPPQIYTKGYYVSSSKPGRQSTFYSQPVFDFSPLTYDLDFNNKDAVAIGEILTEGIVVASRYANPVYVTTGKEDAVFCGSGSRALGIPDCGEGQGSKLAALKDFFPAVPASKFGYYTQPNAGHAHQLHYSAPLGFLNMGNFLHQQGLR